MLFVRYSIKSVFELPTIIIDLSDSLNSNDDEFDHDVLDSWNISLSFQHSNKLSL